MNIVVPETVGLSGQRLLRINTVMQKYIDEHKLAGIITMVARKGKVAHFQTFGMADIEANKPMQSDTIFRIYSMSKPITSAAVLMLLEEGRFHLTDPVSRYLPAFKKMKVLTDPTNQDSPIIDAEREITIRDLLTHTAGLSYGFDDKMYIDQLYQKHIWAMLNADRNLSLLDMVDEIAKLPLAYQPGKAFRYSMAVDVLGGLVQVASDMPFGDFLKKRIFDPLGMVDSGFYVPPEKLSRFSASYGLGDNGGLKVIDPSDTKEYASAPKCPSGGGGLVSTTSDYFRFAQMLLNQGELDGVRLLGRKTIECMTVNNLPEGVLLDNEKHTGFGLGVSVLLNLGQSPMLGSVGNYGWSGAASTNFWIDPKEQLIGILMLQYMSNSYPIIADFRNLTYQAMIS